MGNFEGSPVVIGAGRFGPYIMHEKKYVSLPRTEDPLTVTLETAVALIEQKRKADQEKHIKQFDEDPKLELMKGRYGPYIAYDGKNYHIDKKLQDQALSGALSYEECMEIVRTAPEPKARRAKR